MLQDPTVEPTVYYQPGTEPGGVIVMPYVQPTAFPLPQKDMIEEGFPLLLPLNQSLCMLWLLLIYKIACMLE